MRCRCCSLRPPVGEVREPAVPRVGPSVRGLDTCCAAVRPGRFREHRVPERDETADHPQALVVEQLYGGREIEDRLDGADLPGQWNGRIPPDDPALVLEVELDGIDAFLVDQSQNARAEIVVRPRIGGHVHGAHRVGRQSRDEDDVHRPCRLVAGRIRRDEVDGLRTEAPGSEARTGPARPGTVRSPACSAVAPVTSPSSTKGLRACP